MAPRRLLQHTNQALRAQPEGLGPGRILVEDPTPEVMVVQGDLRADDMLVLASDALAQFLLRLDVAGEPVWPLVRGLDPAGFRTLVTEGVAARMLEPDDVTLVRAVLRREVPA